MVCTVLAVIAHPDDEAFGPSGTLAKLAKTHKVHLVCVTDGASDPRFHPVGGKTLATIRAAELRASAKILGIIQVHFFNYPDGSLCNNLYHEIADKLIHLIKKYQPSLLITNELRGVSGHLDHVAVAMITSYVYRETPAIDAIWYNCTRREVSESMKDYFVYFPPGFKREEVDMVVDVSDVFPQKVAAALCHKSQAKDVNRAVKRWKNLPQEEWFLVEKRRDLRIVVSGCGSSKLPSNLFYQKFLKWRQEKRGKGEK